MNRSNCTNLKQFEGGRVVKLATRLPFLVLHYMTKDGPRSISRGRQLQFTLRARRAKRHFRQLSKGQRYCLRFPKSFPSRAISSRSQRVDTFSRVTKTSELTWSSPRTNTLASKSLRLSKTTSRKRLTSIFQRTQTGHNRKNCQI